MSNKNKAISEGRYEVIATISLNFDEFKHATPLDIHLNRLKRAAKYLAAFKNADTKQMVLGLESPTMSLVKPIGTGSENVILLEGMNNPKLDLNMYDSKSSPEDFLGKSNLAKAETTTVIADADKIAKMMTHAPMSASQIDAALNKTQNPEQVRKMLGNMSGSKVEVVIDEELLTIGGHKFSSYCIDGVAETFQNCEILEVAPKGGMVFDVSQLNGFKLSDGTDLLSVRVDVKPDSLEFRLLTFAYAAKLHVDIEVTFTKHVVKQQMKCWLVQILNLDRLSEDISKSWLEVTQKLYLLDE